MSIENVSPILASMGFGVTTGFLIGFAIKKVMKILAVIAGAFFAAMIYLESQNIISINWDRLRITSEGSVMALTNAAGQIQAISTTQTDISLPLTGSMAMGFGIGFMKG